MANVKLTKAQILELIPQQAPFRFVDEIIELDEKHIIGSYRFKQDEFFYAGHFPDNPITPGVILLECMCQIGVVALGLYLTSLEMPLDQIKKHVTLFTDAETEFSKPVYPGDKVSVRAELVFWRRRKIRAQIKMYNEVQVLVAQTLASGIGVQHD